MALHFYLLKGLALSAFGWRGPFFEAFGRGECLGVDTGINSMMEIAGKNYLTGGRRLLVAGRWLRVWVVFAWWSANILVFRNLCSQGRPEDHLKPGFLSDYRSWISQIISISTISTVD